MLIWTCAWVTKSTSSASCSWWRFCYMSKHMYGHVLVLTSRHLVHPAADDDFATCRNARSDMCLCYQVDVYCVLQLMMTLSVRLSDVLILKNSKTIWGIKLSFYFHWSYKKCAILSYNSKMLLTIQFCRIFYFWLVWIVNLNTGGPLPHCTYFPLKLPLSMSTYISRFCYLLSIVGCKAWSVH